MLKKETNNIKNYIIRNYKTIVGLFLLVVATYSIKIFNYNLSIDSEVTVNDVTANSIPWIVTGRWALTLMGKFLHFGGRYNPFFSNIVMTIFFTLSVVILGYTISSIFENKKSENKILILLGTIILTSPILAEMLNFTMMTAEIAIGLSIVSSSIYFTYLAVYKEFKIFYPIAILVLAFAMGIYQAFLPLYMSLAAFIFLIDMVKNDLTLKKLLVNITKIIAIFILAYITCTLITKFLLNYYGLAESKYLTNQINWGKLSFQKIQIIISEFMHKVTFPKITSPIWNYGYAISIFISILYAITILKHHKKNSLLIIICLLFILISPFFIVLGTGNAVAIRTMINLPFIVSLIVIFVTEESPKRKIFKYLVYISFAFIVVIQFKSTLDLFYSDYIRYEEDKELVQDIFTKIDMLDNLDKNREETAVVFVGMRSAKSTGVIAKGDSMSFSFFEWDPATELASNKRIYGLSQTLGYKYKMPTIAEVKKGKKMQNDMSIYPDKKSITIKDGIVIVRVS